MGVAKKRTMPSSPRKPQESQNPKITSLLPRLVILGGDEDDGEMRRLLADEDAWCVGSCNGWLLLLDGDDATPFLVSASSSSSSSRRFYLPLIQTLPFPPQVDKSYFMEFVRKSYVTKAVVVGNPDTDESFAAVVLYSHSAYPRLAYCKNGDRSWKALPGAKRSYLEIMVGEGDALHALNKDLTVQTWNMSGPEPVMTREVKPSLPKAMWDSAYSGLCFSKLYLAESSGEVLLVVREVGCYVNGDGVPVEEGDLLTDEDTHPLVCPYRTLKFFIYKLSSDEKEWVRVKDLGDNALFLGCNNSVALSAGGLVGFEGNCIYFTDDNWEQMNEDYLYGGHDLGRFNLGLGKVEPIDSIFYPFEDRIDPPPFWIFLAVN